MKRPNNLRCVISELRRHTLYTHTITHVTLSIVSNSSRNLQRALVCLWKRYLVGNQKRARPHHTATSGRERLQSQRVLCFWCVTQSCMMCIYKVKRPFYDCARVPLFRSEQYIVTHKRTQSSFFWMHSMFVRMCLCAISPLPYLKNIEMKPLEYISKKKSSLVGTLCRMSSSADFFPEERHKLVTFFLYH